MSLLQPSHLTLWSHLSFSSLHILSNLFWTALSAAVFGKCATKTCFCLSDHLCCGPTALFTMWSSRPISSSCTLTSFCRSCILLWALCGVLYSFAFSFFSISRASSSFYSSIYWRCGAGNGWYSQEFDYVCCSAFLVFRCLILSSGARLPVSPSLFEIYDWKWFPGWGSRLCDPYRLGTATLPVIAVPVGWRRYHVVGSNEVAVFTSQPNDVLPPMSLFHNAAAFSDRLDARQFFLGMRIDRHKSLMSVDGRKIFTARSERLQRWIHFESQGVVLRHCYSQKTYMLFHCMLEKSAYEIRITWMFWRLWRSVSDGDTAKSLIVPHKDLCFVDYLFQMRGSPLFVINFEAAWTLSIVS